MKKHEIEAKLRAAGAFYLMDADDLHEVSATAWGHHFWVPMAGPFGAIDPDHLAEILADIEARRPRT